MQDTWRLIDSGKCGAFYNMALDEAIATFVRKNASRPTLRLYGWDRPSLSLGCFQSISGISTDYCEKNNIPVVRRPTGGRAILHGDEFTYSVSVRTDHDRFSKGLLDSYRTISEAFSLTFANMGIRTESKRKREKGSVLTRSPLCFRSSSFGEILIDNKKVVGSAQKRWPDGLLQQGSIPYSFDEEKIKNIFGKERSEAPGIYMKTLREILPQLDDERFKKTVRSSFEEALGISFVLSSPSPEESLLARKLEEQKYLLKKWNLRQ